MSQNQRPPKCRRWAATIVLLSGWVAPASSAMSSAVVAPTLSAHHCRGCSVQIDGALAEPLWMAAARGDGFVQLRPNELAPATEASTVQVACDGENIYVAVHARDSEPQGVRALLARRDAEPPSDWIRVAFDSYADRRTAFEFSVNPAGVKVDAVLFGESGRDLSWDAVWDVATRQVSDGWIAEFRIPLSELRYSDHGGADWGFQVTRVVARKNEVSTWAPTLQSDLRAIARYGTLAGLTDLEAPESLQVAPYALADVSRPAQPSALWESSTAGLGARAGVDAKLRVTSNLTLDATINPDFGQVEADPSVMNLSAYEPFFRERRPFFVEGNEILRFRLGLGGGDLGNDTLYYSRRLGGLGSYEPAIDDDETLALPSAARIYGALKLSGKTAGGTSLAFLDAVTAPADAVIDTAPRGGDTPDPSDDTGARHREARVVPRTNFLVGRAQQDWRDGHTSLGVIATNVVRDLPAASPITLPSLATTVGIDVSHRSRDDLYAVSATFAASDVRGSTAAIEAVQESSVRYFQRPDVEHVAIDRTRESLQGYAATLSLGKESGEPWRYGMVGLVRSPGFEPNDLGYMTRADWIFGVLWVGYRDYKPGALFRRVQIDGDLVTGANFGGERTELELESNAHLQLLNYWGIEFGLDVELPTLDTALTFGGPAVEEPARVRGYAGFSSDERRWLSVAAHVHADRSAYDRGFGVHPSLTARPSSRLTLSLALNYDREDRDLQYVDTIDEAHWVIGHIVQDTWSVVARADLALTPTLTIQLYAQPFVSSGAYDDYREVVDGRAARYEDRFAPYDYDGSADFNFKQFRSTLVARWEYRLGSTLFAVWSQDRTNEDGPGRTRFGRDLDRLFGTRGEDVFLIKLSYWLAV